MENLVQKIRKGMGRNLAIGIVSAVLSFGITDLSKAQNISDESSTLIKRENSNIGSLDIYQDSIPEEIRDQYGILYGSRNEEIIRYVLKEGNIVVEYTEKSGEMDITMPNNTKIVLNPGIMSINDQNYSSNNPSDKEVMKKGQMLYNKYLKDIQDIKAQDALNSLTSPTPIVKPQKQSSKARFFTCTTVNYDLISTNPKVNYDPFRGVSDIYEYKNHFNDKINLVDFDSSGEETGSNNLKLEIYSPAGDTIGSFTKGDGITISSSDHKLFLDEFYIPYFTNKGGYGRYKAVWYINGKEVGETSFNITE